MNQQNMQSVPWAQVLNLKVTNVVIIKVCKKIKQDC